MSVYQQKDFSDGIDLISDDSRVSDTGYVWAVNVRQRYGFLEPNKKARRITDVPAGLKQGMISIGNIKIAFVAGKAYYQEEDSGIPWIQIGNFLMSTTQPLFYSVAVPASTFNFVRKLDAGLSIHAPIRATQDFKVAGTPAGILVQDTVNQPWLIEFDSTNQVFTARVTGTYDTWQNVSLSANDREYVPIGRQMMYKDGILHIVAPDGKSVYRSITGRPLDFMINVDVNGNKAPTESLGGVTTTSYAFDFDEITCLTEIDVPDSFVYATKTNTRIIVADYTNTIFGEPLFRVSAIVKSTGISNQYSFTQSLNDLVFISTDSVKSFNAVQQLKFKGNSSIFTKMLSGLIFNPKTKKHIKQVFCSCVYFQNYLLFNIDTLWGNLIAAYDVILAKWVSLDITEASKIKQFCLVETQLDTKLYCVTYYDEMFELYGDTVDEVAEFRVRGLVSDDTFIEHKSAYLRPSFNSGTYDGQVFVTEYVDDQLSVDTNVPITDDYRYANDLKGVTAGIPFPVIPPVIPNNANRIDSPSFPLNKGLNGRKISFVMQWTNDAQLMELQLSTSEDKSQASMKQQDQYNKETYEPT